ncbi:MAG: hypothetical protein K6D98_03865 [Clostridiales bacterium]|nr:hypothetical protein [Clostridiales bacterium]
MKKFNLPDDTEACCEYCEYSTHIEALGQTLCKYRNSLRKVKDDDVCKHFSFNIFSYKPKTAKAPKSFDFTKI